MKGEGKRSEPERDSPSWPKRLAERGLRRFLGDSSSAWVATTLLTWTAGRLGEAFRDRPETVARLDLRPGERFSVSARPALTRRERKLLDEREELARRVDRALRPRRRQRRVAKELRAAERRLARRRSGSRRHRKASVEVSALSDELERVSRPRRGARGLQKRLDLLDRELDAERGRIMRKTRRKKRPPVTAKA